MSKLKRVPIILLSIFFISVLTNFANAQNDRQVFTSVEQMPKLHGDLDSLQNEMKYPPKAWNAGIEGRTIIQFIVTKNGKTENLKVIRGLGKGTEEEAKRLVQEARFTPGKQRGKPVNVRMSMPVTFDKSEYQPSEEELNSDKPLPEPTEPQEEEENFFVAVENMPELKGGLGALQKKVKYPEIAREAGVEGRVIIQFIVNKQGKVENPNISRSLCEECDQEALRVVKKAEFEPGRQRGNPVRVQYSLPIIFQIQRDDNKADN